MKNLTLEHIAQVCKGIYYGAEEKKNISDFLSSMGF